MAINNKNLILKDIAIIAFSILIAVILVKTNAIENLITSTKEIKLLGAFIAGMFFTSIFTTAPAIVALGEIAQTMSLIPMAIFGALGALVGDLIIFSFFRDRFFGHLREIVSHRKTGKKIGEVFNRKIFRWLTFLVGAFIIASPLPDELGISMLGFSKMKMLWFIPLSIIFNFIGILIIGMVAKSI